MRFRLLGLLGKLHNIVIYIRGSALRIKEWINLAKRMLPLNNRTRWNSWYLLLIVADSKAKEITIYTKLHYETLKDDFLIESD